MKLTDLRVGMRISGLHPDPVDIIQLKYIDPAVVVTYQSVDGLAQTVLGVADESRIALAEKATRWAFDADASRFKLVAEAHRIRLAHLYDPHIAVNTSAIDPLPHQISAVYGSMLPQTPLRYLLADDPGAGKTIMAGLFIKELILRGDIERCLIVSPGNLVEQWQDELRQKFGLTFHILTNDNMAAAASGNWFLEHNLVIARLDKLSRNEDIQAKLLQAECFYDLIVFDEAHKLAATYFGSEIKYTKRYQLAQRLSQHTRHLLLMTATPHNGKEEDFQLFLSLLDHDRFEGRASGAVDAKDLMRRMLKEELLTFEGKPLFPERIAYTVPYALSEAEATLYAAVTAYVREEYDRAAKLAQEGRRGTVGFALTSLQRRLASSPLAITRSLTRRYDRLSKTLTQLEQAQQKHYTVGVGHPVLTDDDHDDYDELSDDERSAAEDTVIDEATAAQTIEELRLELDTLRGLVRQAERISAARTDTKWQQLSLLLGELFADNPQTTPHLSELAAQSGSPEIRPHSASSQKIVIFTEHRDTLDYLTERIGTLLGDPGAIAIIHGSVSRDQRRAAQDAFLYDPAIKVLLATDAAGEGINLQRAHLMVNYDIPWNPNRLEQRFGRIHRIKQTEVCFLWNLIAKDTREGEVYETLFRKLEEARKALGGQVFNVLGKLMFTEDGTVRTLRDLLIDAIILGNSPEKRNHIHKVVATSLDLDSIKRLIEDQALAPETLSLSQVATIRADLERAAARRLQPHFIAAFFREALRVAGGTMHPRERGRYQITHVPAPIRNRPRSDGTVVLQSYERVTFEREYTNPPGGILASLIDTSHPLLQHLVAALLDQSSDLLTRGAVFVDEADHGTTPHVVYYLDHAVSDSSTGAGQRRTLSRRSLVIELAPDSSVRTVQTPVHLDVRPLHADEPDLATLLAHPDIAALLQHDGDAAIAHAVVHSAPAHLAEVRTRRLDTIRHTREKVHERLTGEIIYWDTKATEYQAAAAKGKPNATLNAQNARRRADELTQRRSQRMAELDRESHISGGVPTVTAGMLVVPIGLLRSISTPDAAPLSTQPSDTQAAAARARAVVMAHERTLGYLPTDREYERIGYDIESVHPVTGAVRMIEVKGRVAGADTFTVTRNEIMTCLNRPDAYYLAIVEFVTHDTHQLHYVKNPFSDIGITSDFTGPGVNQYLATFIARAHNPLD